MRSIALRASFAPLIWGTTYVVMTELLPPHRPMLSAFVRTLPAGFLLLAVVATRQGGRAVLPSRQWLGRSAVLGLLNMAVFFPLLYISAVRLPGGIAAIASALSPFMVALLALLILRTVPTLRVVLCAAVGVAGVSLLVLTADAAVDPLGLAAASGGLVAISLATVLGRRWGLPPGGLVPLSAWQLTIAGLVLLPVTLATEGLPAGIDLAGVVGFAYLILMATVVAYLLWLRGVVTLPPTQLSLLLLLSPTGAAVLGWAVLGQSLNGTQLVGMAAVLIAVAAGSSAGARSAARPEPPVPGRPARRRTRRPLPSQEGFRPTPAQAIA